MKTALIFLLNLTCLFTIVKAQTITGLTLEATPKAILEQIMKDSGITSLKISDLNRTNDEQVNTMFNYITKHGVAAAKLMYGDEGDAIVDKYVKAKSENKTVTEIKKAMLDELIKQLPSAYENKHLMHIGREAEYYVFDVSISSIKPENKLEDFVKKAKEYQKDEKIHRVLGKGEAEKDAIHFEIKK